MMEVLAGKSVFSVGEGEPTLTAALLRANFRRLRNSTQEEGEELFCSPRELLHSVAGLYSVALPDIELEAVYNSLTSGSHTLSLITTAEAVLEYRKTHPPPPPPRASSSKEVGKEGDGKEEGGREESGDEPSFSEVFSASEDDEDENVCGDEYAEEREQFLSDARARRALNQQDCASVGLPDRLVACATYLRLTCEAGESSVQITLLAVRKRYRRHGIGRYLMQYCKDPTVVGQYDKLLAYADPKAESFFALHGFSDDPILTTVLRKKADPWENSTLMVYIPPFSAPATGMGSMRSLTSLDEHIGRWRALAVQSHSEEVSLMERMKHEILLLQTKVQSQEEVIEAMRREIQVCRCEKSLVEQEFSQYRQHMQATLARLAAEGAEQWLRKVELRRTDNPLPSTSSSDEDSTHDS